MKSKTPFTDIYVTNENQTISYRSKDMVYEELFKDGALISGGWNASGYPLNVLKNCPTYLNPKRYAEPFSFNIEIDGQSVDFSLDLVDFKTHKHTKRYYNSCIDYLCNASWAKHNYLPCIIRR